MKIIQIMPEFGLAGAETMCENLSYELVKAGHKVIVVSMYSFHSAITDRMEKRGIDIRYLGKKHGLDVSMVAKFYRIFKEEKPDVVHTHRYVMRYTVPASVMAKVPRMVHTVHNVAEKECGKIDQLINRFFYKYCKVIPVALTEYIRNTISQVYSLPITEIPIIFNGINIEKCIAKDDYSVHKPMKILHIGRFAEAKNHIELIKGFNLFKSEYPDSQLILIGDGELKEQVKELIQELHISDSVNLLGLQPEVNMFLNEADIFILPSLYEGMPMTLIEAMATGLPIITTPVGGIVDMLEDGSEAIFTGTDSESIADSIGMLVNNFELRRSLGQAALIRARQFSAKTMAEKYLALYSKGK